MSQPLHDRAWQVAIEIGVLIGGGLWWRWVGKRNAIEDTRDGITRRVWEDGAAKVGPLGKWQDTPLSRLQRWLDELARSRSE